MYTEDNRYHEIINLAPKSLSNCDICYIYLIEKLENWYKDDFKDEIFNLLSPVIEKYLAYCKHFLDDSSLYAEIRSNFSHLVGEVLANKNERRNVFYYSVLSRIQRLRIQLMENEYEQDTTPVPEILNPELCDKTYATNLITEAINIVRDCDDLNKNVKSRIITSLTDTITELNSERSNWTTVFGKTLIVINTLAALSSIVVNSHSIMQLQSAYDKLKEATQNIVTESYCPPNRLSAKQVLELNGRNFLIQKSKIVLPESIKKE